MDSEPTRRLRVVSAAEAKNQFGRVLDDVASGETVVITRYGARAAVVISEARYRGLTQEPGRELDLLTNRFNEMFARMQAPAGRLGMRIAFDATPEQMGTAAIAAVKRRSARRGA